MGVEALEADDGSYVGDGWTEYTDSANRKYFKLDKPEWTVSLLVAYQPTGTTTFGRVSIPTKPTTHTWAEWTRDVENCVGDGQTTPPTECRNLGFNFR